MGAHLRFGGAADERWTAVCSSAEAARVVRGRSRGKGEHVKTGVVIVVQRASE